MDFPTIQINEGEFLTKGCRDIILDEESQTNSFLNEGFDNILLIERRGDIFFIDCSYRSYIADIIKRRTEPPFVSKSCVLNNAERAILYPLSTSFNPRMLFTKIDLKRILTTNYRIYYITPFLNIENNQQLEATCQGQNYYLYTLAVCGGEECLPRIFGPIHNLEEDIAEIDEDDLDLEDLEYEDIVRVTNDTLREALLTNNVEVFNEEIAFITNNLLDEPANFINFQGEHEDSLLHLAIKLKNLPILGIISQIPGVNFEILDEGRKPITTAFLVSQSVEEFQSLIRVMYNLDNNFRVQINLQNLINYFTTPTQIFENVLVNNILNLLNEFPEIELIIPESREKINFLGYIRNINL